MIIIFDKQDLFPFMSAAVQVEEEGAGVRLKLTTKSGDIVLRFENHSALRGLVNRINQKVNGASP